MPFSAADYKGPKELVHLHNHTVFSELDGIATPEQYAEQCQKWGYPAMSATEHGHMGSVPDMYSAFREQKIKPIFGCEIYFNDYEPTRQKLEAQGVKMRTFEWRDNNPELAYRMFRNRHLTVLCKNETGFHNLVKLTTQAYKTGMFGLGRKQFNRIWFDKLCEHKEGLIILSGCLNGPLCHELRYKEVKKRDGTVVGERPQKIRNAATIEWIKKFKAAFGEDYFIELQMPGIEDDALVFRQLVVLADYFKLKTVITNDCHYLKREDFILQKVMMAIAQGLPVDSPDLFHVNSDEQFMKSRADLWERYKNNDYSKGFDDGVFERSCDNSLLIAERCNALEIDSSPKIPEITNAEDQLRRAVAAKLKEGGYDKCTQRFLIDGKEVTYVEQAKIELKRFIDKGFASYFLITKDLVQYGRDRGWPFSPRGSAGGSLVCFLLKIHVLNPMLWGLSFDRFLSSSRGGYMLNIKMPTDAEITNGQPN